MDNRPIDLDRYHPNSQFRLLGDPQLWLVLRCDRPGYVRGWRWHESGNGAPIEAMFREDAIETLDEVNRADAALPRPLPRPLY